MQVLNESEEMFVSVRRVITSRIENVASWSLNAINNLMNNDVPLWVFGRSSNFNACTLNIQKLCHNVHSFILELETRLLIVIFWHYAISAQAYIVNISNFLFIHYHIHIKIHNDEFQMNCHKEPVKLFVCYLSLYFP